MITSFGGFGYIVLLFVGFNAPAWMDVGVLRVCELFSRGKSAAIRAYLPVSEKERVYFSLVLDK